MTDEEKLALLKALAGENDLTDDVLNAYLTVAARKIVMRAYPYDSRRTMPAQYAALQCEIAAYLVNKRGAEGQTAHSENGVDRTYENGDVPESMLRAVVPHVGVPR